MVLYSDGFTEAENTKGGILRHRTPVQRHQPELGKVCRGDQAVVENIRLHIGAQKVYDDLTLVVLKQL